MLLDSYLNTTPISQSVYVSPVQASFFLPAPPFPTFSESPIILETLALLYPVGVRSNDRDWFIISPNFHIPRDCIPQENWWNKKIMISSVIFYASKHLIDVSCLFRRDLPYPISFDGNKVLIRRNGEIYNILEFGSLHRMTKAVKL
jgi:hypothetical protein